MKSLYQMGPILPLEAFPSTPPQKHWQYGQGRDLLPGQGEAQGNPEALQDTFWSWIRMVLLPSSGIPTKTSAPL